MSASDNESHKSFRSCSSPHPSDSEEEFSDDETNTLESNIELLLKANTKIETENFTIYIFRNSLELIQNIIPWTYNNPLNIEHVKSIKTQLLKIPKLTGVFTIIQLDNKKIFLLDGHHRHQALLELYNEGELDESLEIVVHCYRSDKINSNQTVRLFHNLNHTKPYSTAPPVLETTIMVIDYLERTYPGIIKDTRVRTTFPFIHKKSLNEVLHHRLESLDEFNYDSIIQSIPDINRYYEINSQSIVATKKKCWETVLPKLERTGCYLGLALWKRG